MDRRILVLVLVLLLGAYWLFSGDSPSEKVDEKSIAVTALNDAGCREGHDICALKQARETVATDFGGAAFFCRSIDDEAIEDQCHYEIALAVAEQGAYPSAREYCTTIQGRNALYTPEGCRAKVLEIENRQNA